MNGGFVRNLVFAPQIQGFHIISNITFPTITIKLLFWDIYAIFSQTQVGWGFLVDNISNIVL